MSIRDLAKLFRRGKTTIADHLQKHFSEICTNGRPSVLSDEEHQAVLNLITERFSERIPVTYDEILDMLMYRFEKIVLPDTLRHIIYKNSDLKVIMGVPMEQSRINVSPEEIDGWYDYLNFSIEGIPGEFIFNIDETGCQEWNDAARVKVMVPRTYEGNTIPVPKNKNMKRSTLVAAIAADGSTLTPMVIISRSTIENEIQKYGYK